MRDYRRALDWTYGLSGLLTNPSTGQTYSDAEIAALAAQVNISPSTFIAAAKQYGWTYQTDAPPPVEPSYAPIQAGWPYAAPPDPKQFPPGYVLFFYPLSHSWWIFPPELAAKLTLTPDKWGYLESATNPALVIPATGYTVAPGYYSGAVMLIPVGQPVPTVSTPAVATPPVAAPIVTSNPASQPIPEITGGTASPSSPAVPAVPAAPSIWDWLTGANLPKPQAQLGPGLGPDLVPDTSGGGPAVAPIQAGMFGNLSGASLAIMTALSVAAVYFFAEKKKPARRAARRR